LSTDILSQDEVDALLGGVDDGILEGSEPGPDADIPADVEVFDFELGNLERIIRGRLPTLGMINERFARHFRVNFFGMLRKTPEIIVNGIQMVKYSEYISSLSLPTSMSLIKMEPLLGTGMVMMDSSLVDTLVDNFFGGHGSIKTNMDGREFTATELRIIEKVVQMCFDSLTRAWGPIMTIKYSYHSHETNPNMASIVSPTEVVAISAFHIDLDGGGGQIHVVYPYAMIEPIRSVLDAGVQSERGDVDDRWAVLFKEELMQAKIELQALFVEKKIPLADMINFKAGDIIPIDMPEQVLVLAKEVPIFKGEYGEFQGNTAVKVEEIIQISDPENTNIKNEFLNPGKSRGGKL